MTTMMAKRNVSRNTRRQPQQWPRREQLGTQKDDHGNGQEENNQEHKKTVMTTTKGRMNVTKKTEG
jgi:hypothetical protein